MKRLSLVYHFSVFNFMLCFICGTWYADLVCILQSHSFGFCWLLVFLLVMLYLGLVFWFLMAIGIFAGYVISWFSFLVFRP